MTAPRTETLLLAKRRPGALAPALLRNPLAVVSASVVVLLIVLVVGADLFAPIPPSATDLSAVLQGPSPAHPFGTDDIGRDIWSRLLHGGRLTLAGAAIVLAIALVIGGLAGLFAGYYRGVVDAAASWAASLMLALPSLVVLLALRSVTGPSILVIMAAFGLLISPSIFQLVRTTVRDVAAEPYVEAARVAGLPDSRILTRHILRAVRAPLIIQAMMVAGMAVGVQAALNFLGLGAGTVTWGGMLADSFALVYSAPQLMFWPALFLGAMTAALIVLGNALRDSLDPRDGALRRRPAPRATPAADASRRAGAALLEVRDLGVGYTGRDGEPLRVVQGVDLAVHAGQVVGLVGESGSGKSQIAFAIAGLLPRTATIDSGSILFRGTELVGLSPRRARKVLTGGIAYVPQDPIPNLDPSFTIGFQLTEPLRIVRGLSRKAARRRALELLEAVRIREPEKAMRSYPHEISGGMAQRVLIAGALSMDPVLLVADEPTTALDVTVQAEVLEVLRGLQSSRGLAILLVTHDLGVAADICDRIAVLRHGSLVEQGTVEEVFAAPRQAYTRTLLDSTLSGAAPREPYSAPRGSAPREGGRS
ncbi:dipeptide/oligopeptide/nickel ABC transporter permease/ATP-binding protein [Microbacterium sp. 18062]|uniref:dipeptide/oligopeptide/nickel ABC transporter permease/ATP-binding protein n=1 Tax=Microbacterium sp. 18062 TaxID=2681410 RepID=UPI001357F6C4|nr:dipeptide/oligopeptide/nickel ABC transporter permease/ATP-binding protein [Microbacterium sp. 18062]